MRLVSYTQPLSNSLIRKLSLWFQHNSTKESYDTNRIVCTGLKDHMETRFYCIEISDKTVHWDQWQDSYVAITGLAPSPSLKRNRLSKLLAKFTQVEFELQEFYFANSVYFFFGKDIRKTRPKQVQASNGRNYCHKFWPVSLYKFKTARSALFCDPLAIIIKPGLTVTMNRLWKFTWILNNRRSASECLKLNINLN